MLRDNSNDINIGETVDSIFKQSPLFVNTKTITRYTNGRETTSTGISFSFSNLSQVSIKLIALIIFFAILSPLILLIRVYGLGAYKKIAEKYTIDAPLKYYKQKAFFTLGVAIFSIPNMLIFMRTTPHLDKLIKLGTNNNMIDIISIAYYPFSVAFFIVGVWYVITTTFNNITFTFYARALEEFQILESEVIGSENLREVDDMCNQLLKENTKKEFKLFTKDYIESIKKSDLDSELKKDIVEAFADYFRYKQQKTKFSPIPFLIFISIIVVITVASLILIAVAK